MSPVWNGTEEEGAALLAAVRAHFRGDAGRAGFLLEQRVLDGLLCGRRRREELLRQEWGKGE